MTTVLWPVLRFGIFSLESFFYKFEILWPGLDYSNRAFLLPVFQESILYSMLPCQYFFFLPFLSH